MDPAGGRARPRAAGVATLSGGLFVLPYLYKVEEEPGGVHRGLVWLAALGVLSAALALVTAGLLNPAVAAELDGPFFAAAGLLGDSARLEGLISALWLLPDLVLAGVPGWFSAEGLALGCLALGALTLTVPPKGDK